jgi:tRNA(fMet)-specific endonuclease VapC
MRFLLDTNICIYLINKKEVGLLRKIQTYRNDDIAISTITIAELEYGVAKSTKTHQNRLALATFLIPFSALDFDQEAATEYGIIRTWLEANGKNIGPMDMLLAAQARSKGLVIVTNNEKEFSQVTGLAVENWAK